MDAVFFKISDQPDLTADHASSIFFVPLY